MPSYASADTYYLEFGATVVPLLFPREYDRILEF